MLSEYEELIEALAQYRYRPRDFVLWAFPWGEPGELQDETLQPWQDALLAYLQERMQQYRLGNYMPIRMSTVSGHGIGKSSLIAMLNLWAFSTREGTRGVLTAGTETQLRTKTWVEVAKWHRLFIAHDLFTLSATALFPKGKKSSEEWRLDIVPWSESNTAAFAGLHNKGKRLIMCFDEASEIPQIIQETAAGAETDEGTEIIRVLFGNGTKSDSFFRETTPGGKYEKRWHTMRVDSRDVTLTNRKHIEAEIETYGIDSDYIRVRYLGEFPKQATDSFIGRGAVEAAMARTASPLANMPVVLGVDIGRKNDPTVIFRRQGLDASTAPRVLQTPSVEEMLNAIMQSVAMHDPETVFIDIGTFGWAVLNILTSRNMGRPMFYPVDFGARPDGNVGQNAQTRYVNKRAEIWGAMRDWLAQGGVLPQDPDLLAELTAPTYKFQKETAIQLEAKESVKTRLSGRSTDRADALACTFAQIVDLPTAPALRQQPVNYDYNPYAAESMYGPH